MTVNGELAFGLDLSRYNTSPDGKVQVDFDVIAAHQPAVTFIAQRAGISWGYQDPWFGRYFAEADRIGRARLAYHVLYPGESAQAQMDNFFRILGEADLARTPLVLDLELDHGYSAARITAETTGIAVSPYRKEGLTCLAEIRKLMELGTQNRRLVLAAVTPQRQLRFYEQPRPDQPDLYMDSFSRFFNRQGALLPPWHPPVGRFARFSGTNRINHPWDRRRLPACFVAGAEFWPQTGKWRIRTVDGEPMLEK